VNFLINAEEIRKLREKLNFSQREAASLLGYNHRTIIRWKTGAFRPKNAIFEYLRTWFLKKNQKSKKEKGD